jgi:hypothetical protein
LVMDLDWRQFAENQNALRTAHKQKR